MTFMAKLRRGKMSILPVQAYTLFYICREKIGADSNFPWLNSKFKIFYNKTFPGCANEVTTNNVQTKLVPNHT